MTARGLIYGEPQRLAAFFTYFHMQQHDFFKLFEGQYKMYDRTTELAEYGVIDMQVDGEFTLPLHYAWDDLVGHIEDQYNEEDPDWTDLQFEFIYVRNGNVVSREASTDNAGWLAVKIMNDMDEFATDCSKATEEKTDGTSGENEGKDAAEARILCDPAARQPDVSA